MPVFSSYDESNVRVHALASSHGHAHGPGHAHAHGEASPGHGASSELGFVENHQHNARSNEELEAGAGRGKILFFQMGSGIAGDMTIAALLDLGVPFSIVDDAIKLLDIGEVTLLERRGHSGPIGCTHFEVVPGLQSKERSYSDIVRLIEQSGLSDSVKDLALRIFLRLGQAEAQVHQTTLDKVHFHEVGAVDSIVDIVGAAVAVDYLGARVIGSPVPISSGHVSCRHGVLPLPAPATALCLVGVPTVPSGLLTELVTPTGAAIISTIADDFAPWVAMRPERIGWGAGTKGLPDRPNALRVFLGTPLGETVQATHVLLEANIDDMSGEVAGHAVRQVLAAGALDCWMVAATMKKGRPGIVFSALARVQDAGLIAQSILTETTTIGVRQTLVSRSELNRVERVVDTSLGKVRVKLSTHPDGARLRAKVEFEDCVRLAEQAARPLTQVLSQLQSEVDEHLLGSNLAPR